jgi:hypothetical protein
MSTLLQSFDPTQQTSGTIQTLTGGNPGRLVLANRSGVTLILKFPDGSQQRAWAQSARLFLLEKSDEIIQWSQDTIISVAGGANRVDMELYGTNEDLAETYPISFATPPVISPAGFTTAGRCSPPAAFTFATFGGANALGNFPFSNPAITAGLGVPGVLYALLYGVTVTPLPTHFDGTTTEGEAMQLRFGIYDHTGVEVGNSVTLFTATISDRGAADITGAEFAPASPGQSQINVAVGAGPPYTASVEGTFESGFWGSAAYLIRS